MIPLVLNKSCRKVKTDQVKHLLVAGNMPKFINFLVSLRRLPPLSELSGDEERMLFELRLLWEQQGSLSVADVYDLVSAQSATTSYRQLMALKNQGLVDVRVTDEDRRKRAVTFTPSAEKLFSALG